MRLAFAVEAVNGIADGTVESVGAREGAVGDLMLLEIPPASFDVIEFGRVVRQPFAGDPGALCERPRRSLADVDRPVIKHGHPGAISRSAAPSAVPRRSRRATKSGDRLVSLVCPRSRQRTGSKAPSIARFCAWPGASRRRSAPRRAQRRAG